MVHKKFKVVPKAILLAKLAGVSPCFVLCINAPPPHLVRRYIYRCGHRFVRLAHEAHNLDPLGDDHVLRLNPTRSAGRLKHKPSADGKQHLCSKKRKRRKQRRLGVSPLLKTTYSEMFEGASKA